MSSREPYATWTGKTIGRFQIQERVGGGGTGDVYRAFDIGLRRHVALKWLRPGDHDLRERIRVLVHEGRVGATLHHPAIVATYDILEKEEEAFLVTEWIDGPTLRAHLREPWSLPRFYPFADECLAALAVAHAHGIVHCDVKPENILVDREGRPHINDFGFACRCHPDPSLPVGETVSDREPRGGTAAYLAPERILGHPPQPPVDLFALGIVFYEMLSGAHPFRRASSDETKEAILRAEPTAIDSLAPDLPRSLAGIVHALLERDPSKRPSAISLTNLEAHVSGSTQARIRGRGTPALRARDFTMQAFRYLERPRTQTNLLDAERLFDRALREDPDLAVAWAGLAECWWGRHLESHEERSREKAEEAALRAYSIDPNSAAVLEAMGTTQRLTGRPELAEASFRRALAVDPSWTRARLGLALALERLDRFTEAEGELLRCVRERSEWAEAHAVLGRFCLRRGRRNEAIGHLRDAVDRAPDDSRAYSDLGAALQYEERIDEAIEAYKTSQSIRPNYAALCNLATLYRDRDRPEEASAALERALRLQDRDFLVWKTLALTLRALDDDPDRIRQAFLRSIELADAAAAENPRDAIVLAQLAELYLEVGDKNAARLRIERALALGGAWVDVELSAASVFGDLGEKAKALAHLEAALRLGARPSAIRRDPALRRFSTLEEVAALLRRYDSAESNVRAEKEDPMDSVEHSQEAPAGGTTPKQPARPPSPVEDRPVDPDQDVVHRILVYDSEGNLKIQNRGRYHGRLGLTAWLTKSQRFTLVFDEGTKAVVRRPEGRRDSPALSEHQIGGGGLFHIQTPEGERVATATLIISLDFRAEETT